MKYIFSIITFLILSNQKIESQELNKNIDKDSLAQTIVKDMREDKKKEFLELYNSGSETSKEFLLFMFSMPKSSKKEMIANVDANYPQMEILKNEYSKLIPKDYIIDIEFNPEDKLFTTKESIDIKINKTDSNGKVNSVAQQWNLIPGSKELEETLELVNWNDETLKKIKSLLNNANCVSIENGKMATIGFARSGMGKYSYRIFDKSLSAKEMKEYNDGCNFIFYKKNIVLEYGGGAVGPDCFPD